MPMLPDRPSDRALIGGEWIATRTTLEVEGPSHGEPISQIARCGAGEVDAAVRAAEQAFSGWSEWTARRRGEWLLAFADVIENDVDRLAALECADTGKPMSQARGDIGACARYFRF